MINFKKTIFYHDPFPHLLVDDFLEPIFYEKICKEFPSQDKFYSMQEKSLNKTKFNKNQFSSEGKNKEQFKNFINQNESLKLFYDYFQSQEFIIKLNDVLIKNNVNTEIVNFREGIIKNLLNKIKKRNKILFEFSSIPVNNGFIKPHTDGAKNILGFVIPIIDNEEILKISNLGTRILKPTTDEYKYNYYNKTVPFEKTELVRELPFKKNIMLIHVKTHNSLHAVGPINVENTNKDIYRKSISLFLAKENLYF